MKTIFTYPIKLVEEQEGGYSVTFPDIPEAITQGESIADALVQAIDCLEEAIANRISMKLPIPIGSKSGKNQYEVSLSAVLAAKAALYVTMHEKNITNTNLARQLECDEKEIRRLLDPHFNSKLPRIEHVLNFLGQRLEIGFSSFHVKHA